MRAKSVFISYSHDSPEHSDRVLSLSFALRKNGIDVELDQFHQEEIVDWPRWCNEQTSKEKSDFIICVCTEEYKRRIDGKVPPERGRGVHWEGSLIDDDIYDAKGNLRVIPVLFSEEPDTSIPRFLRGWTFCILSDFALTDSGYEQLVRILTGQARVTKNALGRIPVLRKRKASDLAGSNKMRRSRRRAANRSTTIGIEFVADGPLLEFDQDAWLVAFRKLGIDISRIQITSIRRGSTLVRVVGDPDVIAKVLEKLEQPSATSTEFQADTGFRSYSEITTSKVVERIFGRSEEIGKLDLAWEEPGTHILSVVASGGVGKSHLVAYWMTLLAKSGWRGAQRVFDWSFYSQGLREQGTVSGDAFIQAALVFFGDPSLAQSAASPWQKGARLAELIAQQRTLLVLDGLEPLQHSAGPLMGELRDPGVSALLRGLARKNVGLCVITTRVSIADLTRYHDSRVQEWELGNLAPSAGAELLRAIGVQGDGESIERASEEVSGHAFTLHLLGRYLTSAYEGDVRRRDSVGFEIRSEIPSKNAFKALKAYENWLLTTGQKGARQLSVLRLLGLFDRPASFGCLEALRSKPIIPGLTEPLVEMTEEEWKQLLDELSDLGLVSIKSSQSALDAHPIIREYFGQELQMHMLQAWREAHVRLYDYLKNNTKDKSLPTLGDLEPLYQSIAHGCQGGLFHDACRLYQKRILRGHERLSWKKLGTFGADLGAISCFFEKPYTRISPAVSEQEGAFLLDEAALGLRALGRLIEATDPIRLAIKMADDQSAWNNVARGEGNLSELWLTLGEVSKAIREANVAIEFSDRSRDLFLQSVTRTVLADALHQAGKSRSAEEHFRRAEDIQRELQPDYPLLYSMRGFRFCDLLLDSAEREAWRVALGLLSKRSPRTGDVASREIQACEAVRERTRKTLAWTRDNNLSILDRGLDKLTLARAAHYWRCLRDERSGQSQTTDDSDDGVNDLRGAASRDHLPRGLLTRAWVRFFENQSKDSCGDLDEAWEIAERGRMKLHMADIYLYRARLFHGVKPYPWNKFEDGREGREPKDDLADARKLIEQCGYWRRKKELEDAEEAAKGW